MEKEKLSSVIKVLESGARPKGGAIEYINDAIPSLGAEHLNDYGGFNFSKIKYIPKSFFDDLRSGIIQKGDILVVKDGATTGKVSLVEDSFPFDNAAINEHVFLLRVAENKAFNRYIFHFLKSPVGQIEIQKDFRGATVGGISRRFIEVIKLPIPSLRKQVHIANILTNVDALIIKRKETIRLLDEFLKSTFMKMFGDVINNTRNLKIEKLGKYITHLTSGGRNWNKYYSNNGKRFIRSFDVQMNSISDEDIVLVNPPNNQEAKRTKVQANDVLLTITGSRIGRVAYIPNDFGEAYVSQHVAIIRTQKISPLYLSYYLSMENCGQYLIRNNHYGQTKPGLNFDQIKSFDIIIPSSRLQDQFCQIVANVDRLRARYKEGLREFENLYGSLIQRTFKGELQFNSDSRAVSLQTAEREADYFKKRKALACYIINQSLDDDKFGDTKFEKLLFLSDYSAVKRNLGQHYYQKVAGPYDNTFTTTFYIQIENSELFKRKRGNRQTIFLAGANHIKSFNASDYFSEEELKRVNSLIKIFRKSDYEQPEIIATLYAVWNNRIIRQQEITDELLKEDFLKWDAQKIKYKDRLSKALSWMRAQSIVPDGWGRIVDPPKASKTKTKLKSRD